MEEYDRIDAEFYDYYSTGLDGDVQFYVEEAVKAGSPAMMNWSSVIGNAGNAPGWLPRAVSSARYAAGRSTSWLFNSAP